MRYVLTLSVLLFSCAIFAQEPGYLKADPPRRSPPPPSGPLLADKFQQARGLKSYEVQTLHYNRVACFRRIFSQSGMSIEGDADLKSTNVGADMAEIEFPAYINMTSFNSVNPFGNGVQSIETMTGRRLVKTHPWPVEAALTLSKKVTVRFEDTRPPQLVDAITEVRVTEGGYPSTYIVKETVLLPQKFSIYFICQ